MPGEALTLRDVPTSSEGQTKRDLGSRVGWEAGNASSGRNPREGASGLRRQECAVGVASLRAAEPAPRVRAPSPTLSSPGNMFCCLRTRSTCRTPSPVTVPSTDFIYNAPTLRTIALQIRRCFAFRGQSLPMISTLSPSSLDSQKWNVRQP